MARVTIRRTIEFNNGIEFRVSCSSQLVCWCRTTWHRHATKHVSNAPKREPGESPGLSRSGMQERPPSTALVAGSAHRLGSDGH
jgi:hypothetical protein